MDNGDWQLQRLEACYIWQVRERSICNCCCCCCCCLFTFAGAETNRLSLSFYHYHRLIAIQQLHTEIKTQKSNELTRPERACRPCSRDIECWNRQVPKAILGTPAIEAARPWLLLTGSVWLPINVLDRLQIKMETLTSYKPSYKPLLRRTVISPPKKITKTKNVVKCNKTVSSKRDIFNTLWMVMVGLGWLVDGIMWVGCGGIGGLWRQTAIISHQSSESERVEWQQQQQQHMDTSKSSSSQILLLDTCLSHTAADVSRGRPTQRLYSGRVITRRKKRLSLFLPYGDLGVLATDLF